MLIFTLEEIPDNGSEQYTQTGDKISDWNIEKETNTF